MRIDNRIVMVAAMIGQAYGIVVGLERRLERVPGLDAVLVDLNRSIVDLGNGDYLDVVTVAVVLAFSV